MIPISTTNDPSPHVRRRSRTMKVKTLAYDSYEVTPCEEGKAKRLVQFDLSEQGVVKVECVKLDGTGEVCEANSYSKHCAHVEAAVHRLSQNIKQEETRLADSKKQIDRSKKVKKAIKQNTSKRLKYD